MESAQFRYFCAAFSPTVSQTSIPILYHAYKSGNTTLIKLVLTALLKKTKLSKTDAVIQVLKTENFSYFREFVVLNNPRSSLFYFKHCLFLGYLSIHISPECLTLVDTHYRENNIFLQMSHSHRDGYSIKTINKFLKISAAKQLYKIVVRVPPDIEKTMRMVERMAEFAKPFGCTNLTFHMGMDLIIVFNTRMHQLPTN